MKTGVERIRSSLTSLSAWLGLFLVVFSLLNGATMGFAPMDTLPDSEWQICLANGQNTSGHDQDQPGQHHSHGGDCCLSLCCGVATTPHADVARPPSMRLQNIIFAAAQSPQIRPAPSLGGSARAPPTVV